MSKSPAVIGVMGLGACLALSLTMREALQVQQQRARNPLELELESHFARRLAGPALVTERVEDGRLTLVVELRVLAGLRKDRFVQAAARLAWASRPPGPDAPMEVEVLVTDDGDGAPMAATVLRPPLWGAPSGAPPRTPEPRGSNPGR